MSAASEARRIRWEAATRGPLVVLSLLYLLACTFVVVDVGVPLIQAISVVAVLLTWIVFIADYALRLIWASPRGAFLASTVPDAVAVVIPMLRPVVQIRHLGTLGVMNRGAARRFRVAAIMATAAVIFVYSIALVVYTSERNAPGATITSFGDAIWWACVTIFTVGYGDYAPVTLLGRMWAVVLMIGGVAVIGVTSALVVNYLGERIGHDRHERAHDDGADPEGPTPSKRDAA